MPAGPIGPHWAPQSWADTAWVAGCWGGTVAQPQIGVGAWSRPRPSRYPARPLRRHGASSTRVWTRAVGHGFARFLEPWVLEAPVTPTQGEGKTRRAGSGHHGTTAIQLKSEGIARRESAALVTARAVTVNALGFVSKRPVLAAKRHAPRLRRAAPPAVRPMTTGEASSATRSRTRSLGHGVGRGATHD